MRFFTLLPVRDEADIIRENLEHQLTWADRIFVFDTGSIDNTWGIVQEMAQKDKRITPLCQKPVYYSETLLRGYIFHKAREEMRDGDWFVRIDADEFHHFHPRDFIKENLKPHETIVYHQYYNFALLRSEADRLSTPEDIIAERLKPIEQRRNQYEISIYSEPRMCRYRSSMRWSTSTSFPYNAGYMAKARVPIRHYPHRDPEQLDRRCRLRAVMLADKENRLNWGSGDQHHWNIDDWRQFITEDDNPNLKTWIPGTELEAVQNPTHLCKPMKRLVQRVVHAVALPILDSRRPGFGDDTFPQPIQENVQTVLEKELAVKEPDIT